MYEFRDIEAIGTVLGHIWDYRDYYAMRGLRLTAEDQHGAVEYVIADCDFDRRRAGSRWLAQSLDSPTLHVDSKAQNGEVLESEPYMAWRDTAPAPVDRLLLSREVAVDV